MHIQKSIIYIFLYLAKFKYKKKVENGSRKRHYFFCKWQIDELCNIEDSNRYQEVFFSPKDFYFFTGYFFWK